MLSHSVAGITCPRGSRPAPGPGGATMPAEPFGEEALAHTKDMCLQREVEIKVSEFAFSRLMLSSPAEHRIVSVWNIKLFATEQGSL